VEAPLGAQINIARGKPTSQSSTDSGGVSSRAVDGNTSGYFDQNSVTHTANEGGAWWQVDLQGVYSLATVVLYNRTDCCADRLRDFRVRISEDGVNWKDYPLAGVAPAKAFFSINRPARYVRVQLDGIGVLSLAEVVLTAGDPLPAHSGDPAFLARTFAPRLRFDGAAPDYPMSAQPFFEQSVQVLNPFPVQNTSYNLVATHQVPTYFQTTWCANQLRIHYWWFYGYQTACDVFGNGKHHGDWEHVMVTLSEDRARIAAVTFWLHGDHYTRTAVHNGFQVEDGAHPVVYVAKHSHASFHNQGGSSQSCAPFDEYRNNFNGNHLDAWQNLVNLEGNAEPWIQVDRLGGFHWGIDGVSTHPTQNSPSCSVNAAAWSAGVPTRIVSQCKTGDRGDGVHCWDGGTAYGYDWRLSITDYNLLY